MQLVTSDARAGLVAAIRVTLPGAAWQRCRTQPDADAAGTYEEATTSTTMPALSA